MADEAREEALSAIRVRDQLALGAVACLLLSLAMGMMPDGIISSPIYRTGAWLLFGLLAFLCFYLAFPHMWTHSFWLAGIYGGAALGLLLLAGRGGTLFPYYWTAAIIGLLLELAALALAYTLLMRVRMARTVLGSRGSLGLWLLAVVSFFFGSNLAAACWAYWANTGSGSGLAGYAAFEAALAFAAVYICWAPEESVWGPESWTPAPAGSHEGETTALLKRLTGRVEALPGACPACGAALVPVQLRCPSCGEMLKVGWCAASESYVVACPSCGSPALTADGRCQKCGAPLKGLACPGCRKTAPLRDWSGPSGPA